MSLLNAWLVAIFLVFSAGSIQSWKLPLIDKYEIKVLNSLGETVAVECKSQSRLNGGKVGKGVQQLKEGAEFWFKVQKKLFNQNDVYTCTAIADNKSLTFPAFNKRLLADNAFDLREDGLYLRDNFMAPWSPLEAKDVKAEPKDVKNEAKRDLFSDMNGFIQTRIGGAMADPNAVVSMVRSSGGKGGNVAVAMAHKAAKRNVANAGGFGQVNVPGGNQAPNLNPVTLPQLPQLPIANNVVAPTRPSLIDNVTPVLPAAPVPTAPTAAPAGQLCPMPVPGKCSESCNSGAGKKGYWKKRNRQLKKCLKYQRKAEQQRAKLEKLQ